MDIPGECNAGLVLRRDTLPSGKVFLLVANLHGYALNTRQGGRIYGADLPFVERWKRE